VRFFRFLAWCYAAALVAALGYAIGVDVVMLHDPREHLLPIFILLFVAAPLDLVPTWLLELAPSSFVDNAPWLQLLLVALCGGVQAAFLFWLSRKPT
jgi:hypothetical protein